MILQHLNLINLCLRVTDAVAVTPKFLLFKALSDVATLGGRIVKTPPCYQKNECIKSLLIKIDYLIKNITRVIDYHRIEK